MRGTAPVAAALWRRRSEDGPFLRSPALGTADRSRWAVVAAARGPRGTRRVELQGGGVYALTAAILAWCAGQMLAPAFATGGVLGPAKAFDPAAALAHLADFGVTWR